MSEVWDLISDKETWSLIFCAVSIVVIGSLRSLDVEHFFKKNELEDLVIQGKTAMLIPIIGSISLILFFYFFSIVSFLSAIAACFISIFGLVFCIYPIFQKIFKYLNVVDEIRLPCGNKITTLYVVLYPLSIFLIVFWLFTGNWILNNVIAISLSIVSICFIRVPGLKVALMVMGSLFIYDIFWVFYSSKLFGENVMVKVATTAANNPAATIASTLRISTQYIVPTLQLPMKIIFGGSILGLGDIVIPGLLISFTCRFDKFKGNSLYSAYGYFLPSIICYSCGLIIAMIFAFVYQTAQPALLYLVPSTIIPLVFLSKRRK